MTADPNQRFHGIYAATVCPLHADGSIDEPALAKHLTDVLAVDGVAGLLVNGHAGENFMLSRAEKKRVVEIAGRVCTEIRDGNAILVCGINAEDSHEAQRHVEDAAEAGADAILIFPPFSWALSQDAGMALTHHRIANARSKMPMFVYQAGVRAGTMGYSPDVLRALVQLPYVVGVKEGSWESAAYEANLRMIGEVAPDVAVMASGDEHLLTCFTVGSKGSLVSLACVAPELIVGLDRAIAAGDMAAARAWNARIYPLAKAIYGSAPGGHANARLKTCLKLLGRLANDTMRAPMGPLPEREVAMLRQALRDAGYETT